MKPRHYSIFTANAIIAVVTIVIGLAVIGLLNRRLAEERAALPQINESEQLVFHGARLKGFAFGTEGLIADWYWMRSLQYIGDKLMASNNQTVNIGDLRHLDPKLLYPYLDVATDLDPGYITAYSYGAVVLPAIDPEKAIALTRKGIERNPDVWQLYQYLGYIYWRLGRYKDAGETYERGARIAGSPTFLRMMAASMKTEGGTSETARMIYSQMLIETNDAQTKIFASRKLAHLDSLDDRKVLNDALRDFAQRNGRCARAWNEVIPVLRRTKLPNGRSFRLDRDDNVVDPSNAPYLIDQANCQAILDKTTTEIQLQ